MSIEKDNVINPEFATSTHYGEKSLTEEELKAILKEPSIIYNLFKKRGYISSFEYSFITCATFSDEINSELDGRYNGNKSPEQSKQAKKMVKIVEDYFNSIHLDSDNSLDALEVLFIARNDNQCALYNPDRFAQDRMKAILADLFSR